VPEEADAWFFYNGAVGLYFGKSETSRQIYISIAPGDFCKVLAGSYPFEDWPLSKNPTVGEVQRCLISDQIRFDEPSEEDDCFLAGRFCMIECFPYSEGKRLRLTSRPVSMISRALSREHLPSYDS
jgi:hypothetical protein